MNKKYGIMLWYNYGSESEPEYILSSEACYETDKGFDYACAQAKMWFKTLAESRKSMFNGTVKLSVKDFDTGIMADFKYAKLMMS